MAAPLFKPTRAPVTSTRPASSTALSTPTGTGAFYGGGMNFEMPTAAALKNPKTPQAPTTLQTPGQNMSNLGYGEQMAEATQNRLLNDPTQGQLKDLYNQSQTPTQGQNYMNQNLGTLDGPGQGDQYWNQVSGQFQDPFAGEQFTRQATQNFQANGPASAFFDQSMGQYDQFTGYSGPQNSQGQYGQSSASLAGGTQGEQGLGQIAGQYGNIGQYNGPNNALGQYQQNASSGPLAAQQFYNQVQGDYGTKGTYSDPNLAAGQYGQTQQAFGDMPIANFDPFYDRARQLATQDYNRQSAGRGVYGSSEALSGVGNVITDIEAQRANRSFDAEMQRAQEQRARQQLLGEQARMGDLSSLAAFGANLSGVETFGNLANNAGNQTLNQQTMLGNQARASDQSATEAFNQNLQGATTFANINNQLAGTELDRNRLLGDMANNADSQAARAQEANISGLNAFGNIAQAADTAETNRYTATTSAQNNADRTQIDRVQTGANIANNVDTNNRADFQASQNAAAAAAGLDQAQTAQGAAIAGQASNQDLSRVLAANNVAQGAEGQRQNRVQSEINARTEAGKTMQSILSNSYASMSKYGADGFEDWANAELAPALQAAGLDQKQKADFYAYARQMFDSAQGLEG